MAPRRGRTQRTGRDAVKGGKNRAWIMWIWYLLLGSGSGSRTVGKFDASSVREVVVVGGLMEEFCKSSVGVFVTSLRTEIRRPRCLNTATVSHLHRPIAWYLHSSGVGAPRGRSCVSSCFTGGGRGKSPGQPPAWIFPLLLPASPLLPTVCVWLLGGDVEVVTESRPLRVKLWPEGC